jgi:phosphotransferase system enzyme I (PtsP)
MSTDDRIEDADTSVDIRDLFRALRAILRAGTGDMQQRLQDVVALISAHFQSEVCSLYRTDGASGSLVLKATKGLRPEAVGRTTLRPGEGLVGTVAESRQPLSLEDAQADARFAFRPETGEEIYQSFLGVPLIRASDLLGILVLQHRERRRYHADEIEDCETVAQFLSEMLYQVVPEAAGSRDTGTPGSLRLSAVPISPGLATGQVVLHFKDIMIRRWQAADAAPELARLGSALETLESTLLALRLSPDVVADMETTELLEADLMLTRDRGWHEKIAAAVGQGLTAEAAVQTVREDLRARMKTVSNDYIREHLMDLDELSHRLLTILTGEEVHDLSGSLPAKTILVCRSLAAAELLRADRQNLAGLVVVDATANSHLAIVAKALKIPMLAQVPSALTDVQEADPVILDAVNGQLIVRPSAAVLERFEVHLAASRKRQAEERLRAHGPCLSRDGVRIQVMANAGLLLDLDGIVDLDADGIGLYRTEIAFLIRDRFPSVTEQASLYSRIYDRMGGKPVVFRTLDLGSDKKLPYFDGHEPEENPALGWRAIRIGLDHPGMLRDQLRALVTAAGGRALRVKFPMVSVVEEFEAARAVLTAVLKEHVDRGGAAPAKLEVGVMIEVPALLWDLDRLFALADFASVGSNDLFQFLTAADRNNPKTDQRFDVLTAANLRLLMAIAASARRAGKPVSLCGELAGTPLGAIALIGCGFRAFSMDSTRIAEIKSVVRAADVAAVENRIADLAKHGRGPVRNDIADLALELDIAVP